MDKPYLLNRIRIKFLNAATKKFWRGMDDKEQARAKATFMKLDRNRTFSHPHKFKHFTSKENGLYEYKDGQIRIGCFWHATDLILVCGFRKKGNKWPTKETRNFESKVRQYRRSL